ncbi:MAG: 5-formyltetrahydrofolate cyclo-ligase [Saprospiraceae bacterium]|nr:5-formyltetrahydrofolate cyclo-ligase [Saprospiraceae bacterium]
MAEDRQIYSQQVCAQLRQIAAYTDDQVLHSFIPIDSEVDISPFLRHWLAMGKSLVTPQTLANRRFRNLVTTDLDGLHTGIFNTKYASGADQYLGSYDIILVPGLAFTQTGYRMGYGGGYYDTFLAQQTSTFKVGVGFPSQLVETLPLEDHDVSLNLLLLGDQRYKVDRRS